MTFASHSLALRLAGPAVIIASESVAVARRIMSSVTRITDQ